MLTIRQMRNVVRTVRISDAVAPIRYGTHSIPDTISGYAVRGARRNVTVKMWRGVVRKAVTARRRDVFAISHISRRFSGGGPQSRCSAFFHRRSVADATACAVCARPVARGAAVAASARRRAHSPVGGLAPEVSSVESGLRPMYCTTGGGQIPAALASRSKPSG